MNHPAWILGHVAGAYDLLLKTLGQPAGMPAGWDKLFGWGTAAVADRSLYPAKAELLQVFESQHSRAAGVVGSASAQLLSAPIEDPMLRQFMPTVGGMVASLMTSHEAIHLGQLSAWRLAMGMGLKY